MLLLIKWCLKSLSLDGGSQCAHDLTDSAFVTVYLPLLTNWRPNDHQLPRSIR